MYCLGDSFIASSLSQSMEFKIVEIYPQGIEYAIVAPDTVIHCDDQPIQREDLK